jgi:hypothetical protein
MQSVAHCLAAVPPAMHFVAQTSICLQPAPISHAIACEQHFCAAHATQAWLTSSPESDASTPGHPGASTPASAGAASTPASAFAPESCPASGFDACPLSDVCFASAFGAPVSSAWLASGVVEVFGVEEELQPAQ